MGAPLEDILKQTEARPEFAKLRAALLRENPRIQAILLAEEYASIDELAECFDIEIPQYTITRKAGHGGFGLVYKAVHSDGARAVKILAWPKRGINPKVDYAHTIFGEEGIEQNERIADAFRHEHIVRYYGRGALDDGTSYLIFEWINGMNLEKKGKVCVDEFATYMPQILKAIAHLHAHGYLHNDIRRPNIMIDNPNGSERVTLLDYTIACAHSRGVSSRQASLASREIFAPEALHGSFFSTRTDIWALGNLMYQMLAGEHPFSYENKEQLLKIIDNPSSYIGLKSRISQKIPRQYRSIIQRCLAYDPEQRYSSVNEIIADFAPRSNLRWSLPVGVAVVGLLSAVWAYQYDEPPQNVPISYKQEQRQEKKPWQFPQRIKEGEDKYAPCISLPDTTRDACMNFRDAEELLDKKEYARAALVLEDVLAKDQSDFRYYAALLHAYAEMGRITEAYDVLQEMKQRFPGKKSSETAVYAPEIIAQLVQSGPGFREFTTKQCDIPFLVEKYPECRALVTASTLTGEEAIAAYREIAAKHPLSALAHHALGGLLIQKGEKRVLPGGIIVYDNIETMNEGLSHYKHAAEISGNPDGIFREIGDIFHGVYHDHALAFLFYYKGRLHKNSEDVDNDIAIELIDINRAMCRSKGDECFRKPQIRYAYLAKLCTKDDWTIQNCPNWQNIPNWKPPKD